MAWRVAFVVPAAVALIAIYVARECPESPYWVRTQDRKRRIKATRDAGGAISAEDQEWLAKDREIPLTPVVHADMWRNTAAATFVAAVPRSSTEPWAAGSLIFVEGARLVPRRIRSFYIWWGLIGFLGLLTSGLIADRFGRRPAFYVYVAEGAIFLTLLVYAESNTELWVYGLLWSIGFLVSGGRATILTAEIYPTRIRGVGNGFTWATAWFVGFVLWPFVTVWLTERTGSFAASFLIVPFACC